MWGGGGWGRRLGKGWGRELVGCGVGGGWGQGRRWGKGWGRVGSWLEVGW